MKYKAKETYKKLDDSKNFNAFFSSSKHKSLMDNQSVEITDVPKQLIVHLKSVELKKDKK